MICLFWEMSGKTLFNAQKMALKKHSMFEQEPDASFIIPHGSQVKKFPVSAYTGNFSGIYSLSVYSSIISRVSGFFTRTCTFSPSTSTNTSAFWVEKLLT